MPTVTKQLMPLFNTNADELELRGSSASHLWNFVLDSEKNLRSRPGHVLWHGGFATSTLSGIWRVNKNTLALVSDNKLHFIDQAKNTTTVTLPLSTGSSPCAIVDDSARIFIASGGAIMQYTDATGEAKVLQDPVAPKYVTSLVLFDGYLLANETGTGRIWYAAPVDPEPYPNQPYKWGSPDGGFFSAETEMDNVIAVTSMWRQLVVFGSGSIEFWANDGSTPFSRSGAVVASHGILSPNAFTKAGDSIYFLDHRRRMIRLDNGSVTDITGGLATALSRLTTTADVVASYVQSDDLEFVVFNFRTDKISLVYNIQTDTWQEWGVWSQALASFTSNLCHSYIHAPNWNKWVGLTRDGRIMEVSKSIAEDDGTPIRSVVRTGFTDAGTMLRKFVVRDVLMVRRGRGTYDEGNPANTNYPTTLSLRYRDDSDMQWKERRLDLGKPGEHYQKVVCNRMGSYVQRQYELEYSDRVPVTIRDFYTDTEVSVV